MEVNKNKNKNLSKLKLKVTGNRVNSKESITNMKKKVSVESTIVNRMLKQGAPLTIIDMQSNKLLGVEHLQIIAQ